ncbi:nuclear transport factor 2 family protein [Zhongshania aquimaris]|uniref:Nuclear transport factor 2 family protein n=1 Tax=Zhongshania aquimaris TaxID=2857107 RepID=A0ABS6VV98_9GAMM|nr:nuclear transport factor 2 family protein [Zhongshania aquimaris]MBW2942211.1 nuclear transport factor 2 family protein [Zhongshania aquimaris]
MDYSDYNQVRNLIMRYAYYIDHGDIEGMSQLFSRATVHFEDGKIIDSSPTEIEELFRAFLKIYPNGTPRTKHVISNLIIEPIEKNYWTAKSYVTVFQQTDDFPLQPIITGEYHDKFEKAGNSWRFAERYIINDLFGDLSSHGKYEYNV